MKAPVYAETTLLLLCKKSVSYIDSYVTHGWLAWIDPADKRKGAVQVRRFSLRDDVDHEKRAAGWGFDSAWTTRQSGYAGPLVMQLNTQ